MKDAHDPDGDHLHRLPTRRSAQIIAIVPRTRRSTGSSRSPTTPTRTGRRCTASARSPTTRASTSRPPAATPRCRKGIHPTPPHPPKLVGSDAVARLDLAGETLILHLSLLERLGGFVRGDAQVPLASGARRAGQHTTPGTSCAGSGCRAPACRGRSRSGRGASAAARTSSRSTARGRRWWSSSPGSSSAGSSSRPATPS